MREFESLAARFRGTVVEILIEAAMRRPGATALVCGNASRSYAEYADGVLDLASRLQGLSIGPGDRVAVVMRNGIGACLAHFGVLASGAQLLPMNPDYTTRELAFQLDDAKCGAIIAETGLRETIKPLLERSTMKVLWMGDQAPCTAAPTVPAPDPMDGPPLEVTSLAILQYTGGTSGRPKGVDLSHASLYANVAQREAVLPTRPDGERVLCAMPLFHSYGMAMGLYLAARCAGTLIILPSFRREDVFDAVEHAKISIFPGSPSIFVSLMAHQRFATTDWSSVRVCYSGASALPASVLRQWEETVKVPIFEGYGQTEAGPVLSFNGPLWPVRANSVGRPLPGTAIEIVDLEDGTTVLGANTRGEIRARGPQVMQRYRNLPAETAEALRDGWLYTGDIGEIDEDGYLFIRGRKKDLVIVGGYNVYPREVEEVLLEHPAVLEAAVIGEPDAYRGERLHAFVVARAGAALTMAEVEAHCAASLAKYKCPARTSLVEALPKTAINKIDKNALKRTAAAVTVPSAPA